MHHDYFITSKMTLMMSLIALILVTIGSLELLDSNGIVRAQIVNLGQTVTNGTGGLDVKIDPTETLPPNGTIIVDITGANDIDVSTIPPDGVTIVVMNNTVTVTKSPVVYDDEASAANGLTTGSDDNTQSGVDSSDSDGGDGDGDSINIDADDEDPSEGIEDGVSEGEEG